MMQKAYDRELEAECLATFDRGDRTTLQQRIEELRAEYQRLRPLRRVVLVAFWLACLLAALLGWQVGVTYWEMG